MAIAKPTQRGNYNIRVERRQSEEDKARRAGGEEFIGIRCHVF
jgi:hypothetical protein